MAVEDDLTARWLQSRVQLGIRPGLERMKAVLAELGHPEEKLRFVHVAGTNGKGSVSAALAALLRRELRVGMFTSPGLEGRLAQFEVVGETRTRRDFDRIGHLVQRAETQGTPADPLTEFEALTAMALAYFQEQQVDMVILEAGMGGRFDSTNVMVPLVSVITNVTFDHVAHLGPTLADIATHKAGIIKPDTPVVTAASEEALTVIRQSAEAVGTVVKVFGIDFGMTSDSYAHYGQLLTYRGLRHDWYRLLIPLYGIYQAENTAVALAAYEMLTHSGAVAGLPGEEVRRALAGVHWPGRFELSWLKGRAVVLDGAHNPAAARALSKSLKEFNDLWRITVEGWTHVVGVLQDKDIDTMLEVMSPLMSNVIICEPNHMRALAVTDLEEKLERVNKGIAVHRVKIVAEAVRAALRTQGHVACWGSLYTVEEARKAITTVLGDS